MKGTIDEWSSLGIADVLSGDKPAENLIYPLFENTRGTNERSIVRAAQGAVNTTVIAALHNGINNFIRD